MNGNILTNRIYCFSTYCNASITTLVSFIVSVLPSIAFELYVHSSNNFLHKLFNAYIDKGRLLSSVYIRHYLLERCITLELTPYILKETILFPSYERL